MKKFFLHGLESSGNGTKGRYFKNNFSEMIVADYSGTLQSRLQQLEELCGDSNDLVLVGSSFGGLMATCFAIAAPSRVRKLILMAPALNFPGFKAPQHQINIPTYLLIGSLDDLTPAEKIIPLAEQTFSNIEIHMVEEDHMLHQSFSKLDWKKLLTVE